MRAPTRRAFARHIAGTAAAALGGGSALLAGRAGAQEAVAEGRDFIGIDKPVQMPKDGRIHVVEFFWYGCPHCYAFEPHLEPWVRRLPPDVSFRRVPYGFDEALRETHQRIYFTLEVLGLVEALHAKVFDHFHRLHRPINTRQDMLNFAHDYHADVAKVGAAWDGFAVATRMRQAKAECESYGVDFVPLVGIQGRFLTTPRTDADGPRALAAAGLLIDRVRKGG
jgi:thiol:disulfide interchange protein DsbA